MVGSRRNRHVLNSEGIQSNFLKLFKRIKQETYIPLYIHSHLKLTGLMGEGKDTIMATARTPRRRESWTERLHIEVTVLWGDEVRKLNISPISIFLFPVIH